MDNIQQEFQQRFFKCSHQTFILLQRIYSQDKLLCYLDNMNKGN